MQGNTSDDVDYSPAGPDLLPGRRQYTALQRQVMQSILQSMPEPKPGDTDKTVAMRNALRQWTQGIRKGEADIARLGPRVDRRTVQRTVELQFRRTLVYWRMFRFSDLPPEIISNIFRLVVWSAGHPSEGVRQRLRITWVCRSWRAQAIGDPTLWNAIWFRDPPPYERSLEWFNRAGASRLDIRLNEMDPKWSRNQDDHKFTAEQMSNLLDKLFVKLPQIRMLVVIVDNWPPALTVLQKLQTAGNAGISINLERLEIHRMGTPYVWIGPGFDTGGHRDPAVLNGGQTKLLNHLCLSGIHIDWRDTPLSGLTTLDLRSMAMNVSPTLERFREVLRACPLLDKLALDGCGPQPEEKPFDYVPIDLVHLKTLVLGSFSLPYACFVVAQINAPHVRDLTLMSLSGSDYSPLIMQLTPKFREIRILTLYGVEVEMNRQGKKAMVRWLDAMPDMAYARIARMKLEVLKMFLEDPLKYRRKSEAATTNATTARRILCPKFNTMEVQAMPAGAIIEFCRARRQIGVPFKKMYLNTPWAEKLTADDLKEMRQEALLFYAPLGANTAEENELLT